MRTPSINSDSWPFHHSVRDVTILTEATNTVVTKNLPHRALPDAEILADIFIEKFRKKTTCFSWWMNFVI